MQLFCLALFDVMRTKGRYIRETILPFKFVFVNQVSFSYLARPHILKVVLIMISYILIKYISLLKTGESTSQELSYFFSCLSLGFY